MTRRTILPLAILVLALLLAAAALAACGGSSTPSDVTTALKDNDQVSQYSDAFAAAGISGNGPFTVVAATNDALTKAGVKLTSDAVKASVVDGTDITGADAAEGTKGDAMLSGNTVYMYTGTDGQLYVNSYKVVGDPISTGNGTVYIVDGVIQPK
jgi:uncharacterized surface protein with fasciclin (FAS1) repeats